MSDAILLVDDDAAVLRTLGGFLEQQGLEVARELDGTGALAACDKIEPDVAILDAGVAPIDGQEVLTLLRQRGIPVVLILEEADEAQVTAGLRRGAEAALPRPQDPAALLPLLSRLAELSRMRRAADLVLGASGTGGRVETLGMAPPMKAIINQVAALAQSDRTTVLIQGEPGVGKTWAARLIHDLGVRAREPFLKMSCVGYGAVVLEARLFGVERGATAESRRRTRGVLEVASRGTVVLREIGALPIELQPALLRTLESRAFRRLGGTRDVPANARLIVTSSRNLGEESEAGRFRGDLHYRLSTMVLTLPPVRDRSEGDRRALIDHAYARLASELPEPPLPLAQETMERLLAYAWPGNVREIRQVLSRAAFLARGSLAIGVEHLAPELRARPGLGDRRHTPMSLDDLERHHIERTLRYHGGNRTRAARELGISRATLINKIKLYRITE